MPGNESEPAIVFRGNYIDAEQARLFLEMNEVRASIVGKYTNDDITPDDPTEVLVAPSDAKRALDLLAKKPHETRISTGAPRSEPTSKDWIASRIIYAVLGATIGAIFGLTLGTLTEIHPVRLGVIGAAVFGVLGFVGKRIIIDCLGSFMKSHG